MIPTSTNTTTKNVALIALWTALILAIPLVAMQFTSEVDWGLRDFVIMGILLFGSGLVYETLSRTTGKRVIVGIVVAVAVFLIWAELAVGVFGSPFAGS